MDLPGAGGVLVVGVQLARGDAVPATDRADHGEEVPEAALGRVLAVGIHPIDDAGVVPGLHPLEPLLIRGSRLRGDDVDRVGGLVLVDDLQTDAGSMLRVKGSDTLCPLDPGLVSADAWDPRDGMRIRTLVNGEVGQDSTTAEMTWDMAYLVADLARTITLEPGDVILSGTPANSRPVEPGDIVEVEVEGLGTLRNTIVTCPTAIRDDVGAQPTESEEVLSTALGGDWEFRGLRKPQS